MSADNAGQVRVKELFNEAVERPPAERAAFLDAACGDNAELRVRIDRLLLMLDEEPDFLKSPPPTADHGSQENATDANGALTGTRIGHYELTHVIAAGGMGTVYEAIQENPHRTVAVKVMRHGIASKSALRRFEYESQILARLRHPAIAQVHEAGTYDDGGGGVPYFVMEYVPDARPITDYVKHRKLGTRDRLELFTTVCEAVHHGHQRGIIHRDLKPANILIDALGQPKIIDFGVARATDSDVALTTLQTDMGELIGTLQYMSPEQCRADPDDMDTRSDVYALGVVLYELLCEQLPYDITKAPVPEAVRMIREENPPRPSTINKTLRGDAETILLKSLTKERDRRYQSASDLAGDITRFLRHEPIVARPPSAIYQFRKFARRHRGLVGGLAAVFVVLVGASIVSTLLYLQATKARAEMARQAAIAEAVNEFLNNDLLAAVSPEEQGREVSMREVLDVAAENIEGEFRDKPLVEAAIRMTLGRTYYQLGHHDLAEPQLEEARRLREAELGAERPETLETLFAVAELYREQGRYQDAQELCRDVITRRSKILGETHPDTVRSRALLGLVHLVMGDYDDAERVLTEAVANLEEVLGAHHEDTLDSSLNLAVVYSRQGRYDDAERTASGALGHLKRLLGDEHPNTLDAMNNLASIKYGRGHYEEAEQLFRDVVSVREQVQGEKHPDTLIDLNNLASVYASRGRLDEAISICLTVLAARRDVLGDEHPNTLDSLDALGNMYRSSGRYDAAEPLLREALAIRKRVLGGEHPDTLATLTRLGQLQHDRGRHDEAEVMLLEALDGRRRVLGDEHPDVLRSMAELGSLYGDQGRFDEAEPLHVKVLAVQRRVLGHEHLQTLWSMCYLAETLSAQRRYDEAERLYLEAIETLQDVNLAQHRLMQRLMRNLALMYNAQHRWADAEPLLVEALQIKRRTRGDEHPETLTTRHNLATWYREQRRFDEAERLYLETIEIRRRVLGSEHEHTMISMIGLASGYLAQGRFEDALPWFVEGLAVCRKSLPENHLYTGLSLMRYGDCLTSVERLDDAESALLEAHEILIAVRGAEHAVTLRTVDLLAELYEARGRPDLAEDYRALLPAETDAVASD